MIPFEALLPYGVIFCFFAVGGSGMSVIHAARNGGKRDRTRLDQWERQLMERDYRLTGVYRAQSDSPIAQEAFKTSAAWKLQRPTSS